MRRSLALLIGALCAHGLSGQATAPSSTPLQGKARQWVRSLEAVDAVEREIARRQLALTETLPVAELTALLRHARPEVVAAAAALLQDRGAARDALRPLVDHPDPAVRRIVLPVASDAVLPAVLRGDASPDLRTAALHVLEDRGILTDELVLEALGGAKVDATGVDQEGAPLSEAAARILVWERSPFPVALADRALDHPVARHRLLQTLAGRPRETAGAWLERVLGMAGLAPMDRVLAIHALPVERLSAKHAAVVLQAVAASDLALSNRAGYAAARLPAALADGLIDKIDELLLKGTPFSQLAPCLERVSPNGEQRLLGLALAADRDASLRADFFHWMNARESRFVDTFVARALDSDDPFPVELLRLCGPSLAASGPRQAARIQRVAALLEASGQVQVDAFEALIEAEVYHPAMYAYAAQEAGGRRLWRILRLPRAKLPTDMFVSILETRELVPCTYAAQSLGRAPIPSAVERLLLPMAEGSLHEPLQLAASWALMLFGSEAAGRKSFAAVRQGEHTALAIQWLMQKPKPWSYEILLKERERLQKSTDERDRATLHRVLIALAKMGDRGAREALVEAIPALAPDEMRQVEKLMGRFLKKQDLEKLAAQYLVVREGEPDKDLTADAEIDDERRTELLDWFVGRKGIDIEPILTRLWQRDRSYEVRLVALRGLLARQSDKLHAELREQLAKPYHDDSQQELAFEVVGSMNAPITAKSMELLAYIVLRAPLTNPAAEIALALEQSYDGARGAYPLLTPVANLLRRDETARPGPAFEQAAAQIRGDRYVLNRQRLGLFLSKIHRRDALAGELGPVLARLILASPDRSLDFVPPAQMVLAMREEVAGNLQQAATLYASAHRGFARGIAPDHIRRSFLDTTDAMNGYHPVAALAARAPICRAQRAIAVGDIDAAKLELARARDLAEGDRPTIDEITALRRTMQR